MSDLIDRKTLLDDFIDWVPYDIIEEDGIKYGLYLGKHIVEFIKQQPKVEQPVKVTNNQEAGREYAEKTGECPMCIGCPHNCPLEK